MHIAVNLGVQKIASFQVDNFLSEEVDHELNTAMDRFIKQRYHPLSNRFRKGFEHSQKRIDDLRHLVVTADAGVFFNGEELGETTSFYSDRAAFPNDYLFLVSLRAFVQDACKPTNFSVNAKLFKYQRLDLTPPVTGYKLVKVGVVAGASETMIAQNVDGLTTDQLLNPDTYTISCIPVLSVESISSSIVESSPTVDGNEIYLKIDPEQYTGTLATVLYWDHPTTPTEDTLTSVAMVTAEFATLRTRQIAFQTERLVSCDYSQLDDIYTMLDDPFNTTKSTSPLFTIQENFVDVYTNDEFVIPQVKLKYIRRPQRLSKSLGVGCELPEHTHQEIVEMAIKSILEGIQDPRYQSQTAEVAESE